MELIDYFKAIGWRLWVLIGLPLAAALVPVGMTFLGPTQYADTVTVNGAAFVTAAKTGFQYSGFDSGQVFAGDFAAAAKLPVIADPVAKQFGLTRSQVTSGITSAEVGTSSRVTLTYSTHGKALARNVALAEANGILNWLFGTQLTLSQIPLNDAKASAADHAVAAFVQANHTANPAADYLIKARALAQLQEVEDQNAALQRQYGSTPPPTTPKGAAGQAARSTAYGGRTGPEIAAIARDERDMTALVPLVTQFEALHQQQAAAHTAVDRASAAYDKALRETRAAHEQNVIELGRVHTSFSGSKFAKLDAGVAGGAVAVALAFVIVWEIVATYRRGRQAVPGPAAV